MAHTAAGRRGAAGDEADHRFLAAALGFVLEKLRGILLGRAADFADHDERFSFVIGEKHFQDFDEVGALHRVAADADRRGLAKAYLRGLKHRLVGQRAGTRYDPHLAGLENTGGHNADLALSGSHDAGTIWSDQARARAG